MRKLVVLFAVIFGLALLTGCGSDSGSGGAPEKSSSQDSGGGAAPSGGPGARTEFVPGREQAPQQQDTGTQTVERKEVVTGTVDLTAADPIATAATLVQRVNELDGRVDKRTERPGTGASDPRATLVVRIPAESIDKFLEEVGTLGTVTEVSTNRDDVTLQWQDLDARITALRASIDRLRALITNATNTADLIAAEDALTSRQADLDSLTAQKRALDDEIALSTLTIDIRTEPEKSVDSGPDNFWDGLVDGWNSLVDWLKDAVITLGQALPWLAFLAILGGIVFAIIRAVKRRTRRTPKPASRPATTTTKTDPGPTSEPAANPDKTSAVSTDKTDADKTDNSTAEEGDTPATEGE